MNEQNPSQSIHKKIMSQHGRDVLSIFRKAETTAKKVASWRNHRIFNLRCYKNDIIPTSIKIKSNVKGTKADKIIANAERNLLQCRIRQTTFTLQKLRIQEEDNMKQLYTKLEGEMAQSADESLSKTKQRHYESVQSRQVDK